MVLPCFRLSSRHTTSLGLVVRCYATQGKAPRSQERRDSNAPTAPVFQYVGQNRKLNHKVFVWGFSFTGALGLPSLVQPDCGRKKPRKYQLTPYRLETEDQVQEIIRFDRLWGDKVLEVVILMHSITSRITLLFSVVQISSAACGYGFTLLSSTTKDVTKLWGMGLNKDSQLGFQRTQKSRRKTNTLIPLFKEMGNKTLNTVFIEMFCTKPCLVCILDNVSYESFRLML